MVLVICKRRLSSDFISSCHRVPVTNVGGNINKTICRHIYINTTAAYQHNADCLIASFQNMPFFVSSYFDCYCYIIIDMVLSQQCIHCFTSMNHEKHTQTLELFSAHCDRAHV